MDRAHWRSPSFRGGGRPYHQPRNPHFRGDSGGYGTPRNFTPQQWQQRSPSPYRFQSGSPYSSQTHSPYDPPAFITSTPIHGHGGGGGSRHYFRGGGRFNKRQSFGSTSFDKGSHSGDQIDNWISPEMWSDPWRYLTEAMTTPENTFDNSFQLEETPVTKFAESDFSVLSETENSELHQANRSKNDENLSSEVTS